MSSDRSDTTDSENSADTSGVKKYVFTLPMSVTARVMAAEVTLFSVTFPPAMLTASITGRKKFIIVHSLVMCAVTSDIIRTVSDISTTDNASFEHSPKASLTLGISGITVFAAEVMMRIDITGANEERSAGRAFFTAETILSLQCENDIFSPSFAPEFKLSLGFIPSSSPAASSGREDKNSSHAILFKSCALNEYSSAKHGTVKRARTNNSTMILFISQKSE